VGRAFRVTAAIVDIVAVIPGPAIYQTIDAATSSASLIVIAGFNDDQFDLNPWSGSALLLRQDGAVWLLKTFNFPYRDRTLLGETVPLVNVAATNRSMSDSAADQRYLEIVKILIERGASLEDRHLGFTAVQGSILLGDTEMVQLLVEAGANLDSRVERPGSALDGMNALEMSANLMHGSNSDWHEETNEYLRSLERKN